jgi:hypothetical protein
VPVSGLVPPLADCFNTRPETGPGGLEAQPPGQLLVLSAPPGPAADWPGGTGKTQLAVHLARTWGQDRPAGLLVWVAASSRAAVLSSSSLPVQPGLLDPGRIRTNGSEEERCVTCPGRRPLVSAALLAGLAPAATAPAAAAAAQPVPHLDHIFLTMLENNGFHDVVGNPAAPNLNALARTGRTCRASR